MPDSVVVTPKWLRVVREPVTIEQHRTLRELQLKIKAPVDIVNLFEIEARGELQEVFWTVLMGAQNIILDFQEITRGTVNSTLVHPREVFRAAILGNASGIVIVHNHPSGDATPSNEDKLVTRQLVEAGRVLDIPVWDHVIVTGLEYFSFAEGGLL